jgi:hypothetical protein
MPTLKQINKIDLVEIREGLGLSPESLIKLLLGVNAETVNLWETHEKLPEDTAIQEKLAKLEEIIDLGLMVYTPEGLKEFLSTPLPIFNQHCALYLLQLGNYENVRSALASDLEGTGF